MLDWLISLMSWLIRSGLVEKIGLVLLILAAIWFIIFVALELRGSYAKAKRARRP